MAEVGERIWCLLKQVLLQLMQVLIETVMGHLFVRANQVDKPWKVAFYRLGGNGDALHGHWPSSVFSSLLIVRLVKVDQEVANPTRLVHLVQEGGGTSQDFERFVKLEELLHVSKGVDTLNRVRLEVVYLS